MTWNHPGGDIAGYNIKTGNTGEEQKINKELLKVKEFKDSGYNGKTRRYLVSAEDSQGHESLEREIAIPFVTIQDKSPAALYKGLMNQKEYEITNHSAYNIERGRLNLLLKDKNHRSDYFSLQPGINKIVKLTVAGYDDLESIEDCELIFEIRPHTKENTDLSFGKSIKIVQGIPEINIENQPFIKGTISRFRFSIKNTGGAPIEIITALNNGNSESSDIKAYLVDQDENILSMSSFRQATGENVKTLSNKKTIVVEG